MPKKIIPVSVAKAQEWITNCLGFSLGDKTPTQKGNTRYDLNHKLPIAESFLQKLSELGYELPRQISSLEEANENEFILMVFDFSEFKEYYPFVGELYFWDYHVVRRELDKTWVHKPGWHKPPCEICCEADWEGIYEEFGREYVLFAFAE